MNYVENAMQSSQRMPLRDWPQRLHLPGAQSGKMGWILLWALGVPIPVLLVLFLLRGCT
jgi:hypothetical protein